MTSGKYEGVTKAEAIIFNPQIQKVWEDYASELERRELVDSGREALYSYKNPGELDSALYSLIEQDRIRAESIQACAFFVIRQEGRFDCLLSELGTDYRQWRGQGVNDNCVRGLEG